MGTSTKRCRACKKDLRYRLRLQRPSGAGGDAPHLLQPRYRDPGGAPEGGHGHAPGGLGGGCRAGAPGHGQCHGARLARPLGGGQRPRPGALRPGVGRTAPGLDGAGGSGLRDGAPGARRRAARLRPAVAQ